MTYFFISINIFLSKQPWSFMKVDIKGNFSLGESLTNYIEEKIDKEILKYFDSAVNSFVSLSKNNSKFKVNIAVNDGSKRGITTKSTAESDDAYNAFDLALTKMTKQLRKNKGKMRNYRKKISELKAKNSDLPYILADRWILSENEKKEELEAKKQEEDKNEVLELNVIEEKETEIEEITISEALMKMDLMNLPAYMFINKDNGKINVVYKRSDGNITWINPKK